jgi:threonine/homoserine/homoserine lactone efflux protein
MNNEPLWRTILCWSAVIVFFALPLIVFVIQVFSGAEARHQMLKDFDWLGNIYRTVTALLFGLAGLNSYDKRLNGRLQNERGKTPSNG